MIVDSQCEKVGTNDCTRRRGIGAGLPKSGKTDRAPSFKKVKLLKSRLLKFQSQPEITASIGFQPSRHPESRHYPESRRLAKSPRYSSYRVDKPKS